MGDRRRFLCLIKQAKSGYPVSGRGQLVALEHFDQVPAMRPKPASPAGNSLGAVGNCPISAGSLASGLCQIRTLEVRIAVTDLSSHHSSPQRRNVSSAMPPSMHLSSRSASPDDAQMICNWFPTREEAVLWSGSSTPSPLTCAWLAKELVSNEPRHFVFCMGDAEAVGIFGVASRRIEGRAHLFRIGLAPRHRGKGLSRYLVDAAIRAAAEEKAVKRLTLNVYSSNRPAQRAYERAGFCIYDVVATDDDQIGQLLRMEKLL